MNRKKLFQLRQRSKLLHNEIDFLSDQLADLILDEGRDWDDVVDDVEVGNLSMHH